VISMTTKLKAGAVGFYVGQLVLSFVFATGHGRLTADQALGLGVLNAILGLLLLWLPSPLRRR
jgi:hypothetical protein